MRPCDNPFRVEQLQSLPFRFGPSTLKELLEQLERTGFHGAIVGPHGHGKSTLLAELRRAIEATGRPTNSLRLTEANQRHQSALVRDWLRESTPETVLLLDGAERLSWWQRRTLLNTVKYGLILTTHEPGTLPTLFECRTSHELLADLVQDLTSDTPGIVTRDLRELFTSQGGNIRECLRILYDDAAVISPPALSHPHIGRRVAPKPPCGKSPDGYK